MHETSILNVDDYGEIIDTEKAAVSQCRSFPDWFNRAYEANTWVTTTGE